MNISGNAQAFIIAILTDIGFFTYIIVVTATKQPLDPAIWTVLTLFAGTVNTYFFSSHLANGAAAKALDVLLAAKGLPLAPNRPQPDPGDISGTIKP